MLSKYISGTLGVIFCGCAAVIVWEAPRDLPSLGVAAVLAVLGVQTLYAVATNKDPWIAKIGPLP